MTTSASSASADDGFDQRRERLGRQRRAGGVGRLPDLEHLRNAQHVGGGQTAADEARARAPLERRGHLRRAAPRRARPRAPAASRLLEPTASISTRPRVSRCCTSARDARLERRQRLRRLNATSRNRWFTDLTVTCTFCAMRPRGSRRQIRSSNESRDDLLDEPRSRRRSRVVERLQRVQLRVDAARAGRRSSSCVPISAMRPASSARIRSARRTVDSRCAMTNVVRLRIRLASASCTSCSDSASSAEVASSSTSSGQSLRIARAIASRCRWPPESRWPRSPICAS